MIKDAPNWIRSNKAFDPNKDDPCKNMLYRDQAIYWSKKYHNYQKVSRTAIIGLSVIILVSIIINFVATF